MRPKDDDAEDEVVVQKKSSSDEAVLEGRHPGDADDKPATSNGHSECNGDWGRKNGGVASAGSFPGLRKSSSVSSTTVSTGKGNINDEKNAFISAIANPITTLLLRLNSQGRGIRQTINLEIRIKRGSMPAIPLNVQIT